MSCMTLTNGICRGCKDNVGGIKKAYFIDVCEVDGMGAFTTGTNGEITDYATSVNWYGFVPSKHTGNYVETINVSTENGTVYYNGVLTLNYTKAEQSKINTIIEMAKGELAMIFLDENDKYWWLGGIKYTESYSGSPVTITRNVTADSTNGCVIGGTSFQTGTAMADANGGALTFTCDMARPAIEVIPATGAGAVLSGDLATADTACAC